MGEFVAWRSRGWVVDDNGCHIWTGARTSWGYGQVRIDGKVKYVHRVRYEEEVGPIPDGLVLDHYICDNGPGGCCNPHHCRPATTRENTLRGVGPAAQNARKTHCMHGHELAGDNLYITKRGRRDCRACHRRQQMAYMERRRRVA